MNVSHRKKAYVDSHYDLVKQCLIQDKDVFVEKHITLLIKTFISVYYYLRLSLISTLKKIRRYCPIRVRPKSSESFLNA